MLISITIIVIISQQHFLYILAILIPMNAKSIPAPTRHPLQTSILISQYTIPAITGLDIPLLICASFFPVSITQPAIICIEAAIVSKNITQSDKNILDRIIRKMVVIAEYHTSKNIHASCMAVLALYLPSSFFSLNIILFFCFLIGCLITAFALPVEHRFFNRYLYCFLMGACMDVVTMYPLHLCTFLSASLYKLLSMYSGSLCKRIYSKTT